MKQKRIHIYGKHAVREALMRTPHVIKTIYLSPQMGDLGLRALISQSKIKTEKIDPARVSSQVEGNAPHQGIIALISAAELTVPFEQFMERFEARNSLLVYLDGVQDPHNVGTIIRASAAFGASAVLLPMRGQSPITPGVIKVSAGAAFSIPIVSVENPQQALGALKRAGVHIMGLAGEGAHDIGKEEFAGSTLFVLGNEADGVSRSTRALCEKMLSIPISADVESLNVASAATAALFAWSLKNRSVL